MENEVSTRKCIRQYRRKKIYLTKANDVYANVRLYANHEDMVSEHNAYGKMVGDPLVIDGRTRGICKPFVRLKIEKDGSDSVHNHIATIFLAFHECGAGVATHEIMHAILWAWKFHKEKQQYPIVINSMEEE